jgi:endonuclease YncB( thermonuclease family)
MRLLLEPHARQKHDKYTTMKFLLTALLGSTLITGPIHVIDGPAFTLDGDTVVVQNVHVRLLKGVDAPELNQPGGLEAKHAMAAIAGSWLKCELIPEKRPMVARSAIARTQKARISLNGLSARDSRSRARISAPVT